MKHSGIRSTILATAMLTGVLAGANASTLSAQGLTYDMKMSMQQGSVEHPGDARIMMSGHGKYSDGSSRMDIDESTMPSGFLSKGTYMIVRNGSRNEWVVDPDKKQYYEINIDSAANFSMSSINIMGGLVKMETSDATADMQPMGPGETIQGYSTMKYRVTTTFTSTTSILGRKKRSKNTTVTDIWIAPQLAGLYNPALAASQGGADELGRKVRAAYSKIGKGAFLKTVTQTQSTGDHASSMTMTMELLNIRKTRVPSSAFDVPKEYARVDATEILGALGGGGKDGKSGNFGDQLVDSAKQGAKQGAADEVKSQAKDKAKGVLRGIFGRP